MKQGIGIRPAAGAIDIVAGVILCYILHWFIGFYFAFRAMATFHVGQPGTIWKGSIPWMLGMIGPFIYVLPIVFFLIFLPEAIWGQSIGKKIFGLKIKGTPKELWLRYLIKTVGFWGITLALILGSWQLLVFFLGAGIIVLLGFLVSEIYPFYGAVLGSVGPEK